MLKYISFLSVSLATAIIVSGAFAQNVNAWPTTDEYNQTYKVDAVEEEDGWIYATHSNGPLRDSDMNYSCSQVYQSGYLKDAGAYYSDTFVCGGTSQGTYTNGVNA